MGLDRTLLRRWWSYGLPLDVRYLLISHDYLTDEDSPLYVRAGVDPWDVVRQYHDAWGSVTHALSYALALEPQLREAFPWHLGEYP